MNFIKASLLVFVTSIAFACNSSAPKTEANVEGKKCTSEKACTSEEDCTSKEGCASDCCGKSAHENLVADDISNSKVQVYYFHGTRRCATCEAVEKVTKEAVAQNFLDQVGFLSINREEESVLTEKFKISGQTLIVVSGDKVLDLTSEAFLNARANPDKLTEKLVSTIKPLL